MRARITPSAPNTSVYFDFSSGSRTAPSPPWKRASCHDVPSSVAAFSAAKGAHAASGARISSASEVESRVKPGDIPARGRPPVLDQGPMPGGSTALGSRVRGTLVGVLVEDFVGPGHAQLVARALLDGVGARLEVADVGAECAVAVLEVGVLAARGLHLPVDLPGAQPAALAEPEWILDEDDQRGEDDAEGFHRRRTNTSRPG